MHKLLFDILCMCPLFIFMDKADWPLELDAPMQTFDGEDAQSGLQDQVGMDEFIAKETSAARRGALPNSSAFLNPLEPKFHGIFGKNCPIFRLHGSVPHKVPFTFRFSSLKNLEVLCY